MLPVIGDNKASNSAPTTVAATTVAPTTGTNGQSSASNQNQENQRNQNTQNSQAAESNGSGDNNSQSVDEGVMDPDGYIDEQTAISNVRKQAGSGATVISYTKGYSPDGAKAWVVVVQSVSTDDSTDTVTYYSGYQFCYPAN